MDVYSLGRGSKKITTCTIKHRLKPRPVVHSYWPAWECLMMGFTWVIMPKMYALMYIHWKTTWIHVHVEYLSEGILRSNNYRIQTTFYWHLSSQMMKYQKNSSYSITTKMEEDRTCWMWFGTMPLRDTR